ncbi:MAG: ATP-binding cassette domain-containing protein [Ignavibacteriales bacterium]|nr:ATP-binding cassette domain-containing protein [Ignavibacteriales bacterium]
MKFENINKTFTYKNGLNVKLLDDISFEVREGEVTSLLASAGSGKSTLLKIMSGLELADSGNRNETKACFIPSQPSSFPWMNVTENILFANDKLDEQAQKKLVHLVGLEGYENHYTNSKSLGFRFRIAIARALAVNPQIILLDEPFAAMNQKTKLEMLQLIVDLNKETKTTILLATSNLSEALLVSQTILFMKKGSIGNLPSEKVEYSTTNISDRMNSSSYSEYLTNSEKLAKSFATHQSFTISL